MKNIFLVVIVFLLPIPHLSAQHNDWVIGSKGKEDLRGISLKSVYFDSLRFVQNGKTKSLALASISSLKRNLSESKTPQGILIGAVAGGSVGFFFGTIIDESGHSANSAVQDILYNKGTLAFSGFLLGGIAGSVLAPKSIDIEYDLEPFSQNAKLTLLEQVIKLEEVQNSDSATVPEQTNIVQKEKEPTIDSTTSWNEVIPSRETPQEHSSENGKLSSSKGTFRLYGGLAMPLGEFGESSGGAAQTGFLIGAEVNVSESNSPLGWITSINITRYGFDESSVQLPAGARLLDAGSWIPIWGMTGMSIRVPISTDLQLSGSGQFGLLIADSPSLKVANGYLSTNLGAPTTTTLAVGITSEIEIEGKHTLGLRFLQGDTEYFGKVSTLVLTMGISF